MRNWKTVAAFAGAGVALSLLLGMFSGNSLGVVLLRMLLSGIGAGALGLGVRLVIERFLPELGAAETGPDGVGQGIEDGQGDTGRVNIVLPAENPHGLGAEMGEPSLEAGMDIQELGDGAIGDGAIGAGGPPGDLEEGGGAPAESPGLSQAAVDILEAEAADVEGLDPVESAGVEETVAPTRSSRGGLDSLGGGGQDPETVARAVRTMLKRDQEG